MALEIFKLFGSIMVNNEEANKSISKTTDNAEGLGSKLMSGAGTALKFGAAIGTAAIAGGTALLGLANKTAETTDRIDKLSNKIGISKQGFQEWDYIMGQNGMDVEKLQVGVKTLVSQMDAAAGGSKSAAESFGKLGLSWQDGNGKLKSQEEMMNESIMALASMENGTEKAKLATELFGKAGTEMMPMLNNGAEGITDLKDRAHELGLVLSDEAVNSGVVLGDTMDDVKDSFGAVATKIGVQVMPLVQKALDWILEKMPLIQTVFGKVFEGVSFFVEGFVNIISGVASTVEEEIGWVIETIINMKNAFNQSFDEVDDFGQAIKKMIEVITGPIDDSPIFDEIGNIISGIQDVIAGLNNGKGISQAIKDAFNWRESKVGDTLINLIDFCESIFGSIEKIITTVVENSGPIIEGLQTVIGVLIDFIGVAWETVLQPVFSFLIDIIGRIADVFAYVFPYVAEIFAGMCDTLGLLWETILKPALQQLGDFLQNILLPIFSVVFDLIAGYVMYAFSFIGDLWTNSLKPILDGIIMFIGGIFSGNWSQVWDGIVSIVTGIWGGIKTIIWSPIEWVLSQISGITDKITAPFRSAVDAIGSVWSTMKSLFKLPHFSFTGSMNPIDWIDDGMPSVGVEWYAKGGIMNSPTMFGMNGNNAMVGGEAGPEAIAPISTLMDYVRTAVGEANNIDYDRLSEVLMKSIQTGFNNIGIYLGKEEVGQAMANTNDRINGNRVSLTERGVFV